MSKFIKKSLLVGVIGQTIIEVVMDIEDKVMVKIEDTRNFYVFLFITKSFSIPDGILFTG